MAHIAHMANLICEVAKLVLSYNRSPMDEMLVGWVGVRENGKESKVQNGWQRVGTGKREGTVWGWGSQGDMLSPGTSTGSVSLANAATHENIHPDSQHHSPDRYATAHIDQEFRLSIHALRPRRLVRYHGHSARQIAGLSGLGAQVIRWSEYIRWHGYRGKYPPKSGIFYSDGLVTISIGTLSLLCYRNGYGARRG